MGKMFRNPFNSSTQVIHYCIKITRLYDQVGFHSSSNVIDDEIDNVPSSIAG